MASGVIWGIDIGKAALKAVKARRTKDGIEIQALDYIDYGPVGEAAEASEKVREAVRTFLEKNNVRSGDRVAVALPGYTAFSRFIKLPPVDAGKIGEMVRYEAQQQIPFPINEVNWDFQKIDREYEPGEEVEIGIFAIKKELIAGFLSELRMHGIEPDVVTIAPLAVYNFVTYNHKLGEGEAALIVDIGAEHTDLVIVDGERFWIRNLRIAGNDITKGLQEKFKIPFAEAEKLKRTASKSKEAKKIFGVMEPVLKDFVGEVQRSIGFYKSQAKDLKIKKLVLLGDGARLVNIKQFLQKELKYQVDRVSRLQESLVLDHEVDINLLKVHLTAFGVAFGLALQGVGVAKNTINLLPQELRIQSELRQKKYTAIGTAACALLALWLFYSGKTSLEQQVATTIQQATIVTKFTEKEKQIEAIKGELPELEKQIDEKIGLTGRRLLAMELVNTISEVFAQPGGFENNKETHAIGQALRRKHVRRQQDEVEKNYEKVDEGKLWLLRLEIKEGEGYVQWGNAAEGTKDEKATCLIVEMVLAKKLLDRNAGVTLGLIQEFLNNRLFNKLKQEPFYARPRLDNDPEQNPWELPIRLDPPKEIAALDEDMTDESKAPRRSYKLLQTAVRFEVGLKPPPPPEEDLGGAGGAGRPK